MAAKKKTGDKKESVLVLCAHSDDQAFGVGGTLAKYGKEGKNISVVIFSYGEMSHPWLKKKVAIETRVKESHEAAKVIRANETIFLGLDEGRFPEQVKERDIHDRVSRLMQKIRPQKIFTHAGDDPLPDHVAVNKFVLELCEETGYKGQVYSFDVWNPVKLKERNVPRIVVDISDTFKTKIEALRCFKSQKMAMLSLLWSVYFRAIKNGIANNCRYAEVFYKIR